MFAIRSSLSSPLSSHAALSRWLSRTGRDLQFWELETAHCAGLPSFTLTVREGQTEGVDHVEFQTALSLAAFSLETTGKPATARTLAVG